MNETILIFQIHEENPLGHSCYTGLWLHLFPNQRVIFVDNYANLPGNKMWFVFLF